jgi:hypothetical protein
MSVEPETNKEGVNSQVVEEPKRARTSRKSKKRRPRPVTTEAASEPAKQVKSSRRSGKGKPKPSSRPKTRKSAKPKTIGRIGGASDYPRHAVRKALRIPRSILEQNAGKSCTDREAATFSGVKYHGPFRTELSSAIKYGFLSRPSPGKVELTDLGKKVIRPQNPNDELAGIREAVLKAPKISDVYKHLPRGEPSR